MRFRFSTHAFLQTHLLAPQRELAVEAVVVAAEKEFAARRKLDEFELVSLECALALALDFALHRYRYNVFL
ncbi:hypothetical protein D3C72_1435070 [compost metagenome]